MTTPVNEDECYAKIAQKFNKRENLKVICIQGPSASGKSTLCDSIRFLLRAAGKEVFVLNIDNFLQTKPKNVDYYDFDSPATIQWNKVNEILKAFDNKEEKLAIYRYSYKDSESSGPVLIDNKNPEYLIVEGLYAHYLFSDYFFDIENISPLKSHDQIADVYVKNNFKFNNFSVLKIAFSISKEKMMEIRVKRDSQKRKIDSSFVEWQINEQTWPATEKWVYNYEITQPDLILENGSFNYDGLISLKKGFIKFWEQNESFDINSFYKSPYTIPYCDRK
ncbi:hypothetical protein H312_00792 [Anncaliia algerae PRA339]|uniref:Phosphoribulokinase/uridine kinase domain-containing protein n=1 Tax=Anncaliia algerae PRA339 TaxID=1288291 RepID=A0A059F3R9_9MICR|nr:hypothetical protein H312_00792 [Anncaliia algerae PRA339]